MNPPQSNIFKEHPRKFMLAGAILIACAFLFHGPSSGSTDGAAVLIIGIITFVIGFGCWIDEDRYRAIQRHEWDKFEKALDRADFLRVGQTTDKTPTHMRL